MLNGIEKIIKLFIESNPKNKIYLILICLACAIGIYLNKFLDDTHPTSVSIINGDVNGNGDGDVNVNGNGNVNGNVNGGVIVNGIVNGDVTVNGDGNFQFNKSSSQKYKYVFEGCNLSPKANTTLRKHFPIDNTNQTFVFTHSGTLISNNGGLDKYKYKGGFLIVKYNGSIFNFVNIKLPKIETPYDKNTIIEEINKRIIEEVDNNLSPIINTLKT